MMDHLGKLWRGDVPLWKAYWLWGALGNLALTLLSAAAIYLIAAQALSLTGLALALIDDTRIAVILAYAVLVWVGVWRSATHYSALNPTKHWGGIAKGTVVIGVLAGVVNLAGSLGPRPTSLRSGSLEMEAILAGLNDGLPKQLDGMTRLDRVSFQDSTFIYHNTIISPVAPDAAQFQDRVTPYVKKGVCENTAMRQAVAEGVRYRYEYTNLESKPVGSIDISTCD